MPRMLKVKLKQGASDEWEVPLYFQAGDWAVTGGLCVFHNNSCYKVTHVPSTACLPHCFIERTRAEGIARDLNAELPKFKSPVKAPEKYHDQFKRVLELHGIRLVPRS